MSFGFGKSATTTNNEQSVKQSYVESSMRESIIKATKPKEKPIKPKHKRNVIQLTFNDGGVKRFWSCMIETCIKQNSLSYWKYFELFHTVLKANHPTIIQESLPFKSLIIEKGSYWSQFPDFKPFYGIILQSYCNVLASKLEFHHNNPNIPGGMEMEENIFGMMIGSSDVYLLIEMLTEMLKYWNAIKDFLLELLADASEMKEIKSSNIQFQCKFQPFILCVEEAKHLYNYSRSILYKLHSDFPCFNIEAINLSFMNLYENQFQICSRALKFELLSSGTDLTFIADQNVPRLAQLPSPSARPSVPSPTAPSQISIYSSSDSTSRSNNPPLHNFGQGSEQLDRADSVRVAAVINSSSSIDLQPQDDYREIQKSPRLKAKLAKEHEEQLKKDNSILNEVISTLRSRLRDMEIELNQNSNRISKLMFMNRELNTRNEILQSENASLEEEMKQLKITSGRQFCQLYAALRKKDEILKRINSQEDGQEFYHINEDSS